MATSEWRSQSSWLKVLFFASLVMVALGVYRCSMELTPPADPGVISVGHARVLVPAQILSVPADSLGAMVTQSFTRRFGDLTGAEVVAGEDERAWAMVRLTLSGQVAGELELLAVASSRAGGGVMASASADGGVADLPDMSADVARDVARDMGMLSGVPAGGTPSRTGPSTGADNR